MFRVLQSLNLTVREDHSLVTRTTKSSERCPSDLIPLKPSPCLLGQIQFLTTEPCGRRNHWSRFGLQASTHWASSVVLGIKNLFANAGDLRDTRVRSLGREDPLEEGMATHSSILAWRIPWTEEPGGLQSMGSQKAEHNRAHTHTTHNIHCPKRCTDTASYSHGFREGLNHFQ